MHMDGLWSYLPVVASDGQAMVLRISGQTCRSVVGVERNPDHAWMLATATHTVVAGVDGFDFDRAVCFNSL